MGMTALNNSGAGGLLGTTPGAATDPRFSSGGQLATASDEPLTTVYLWAHDLTAKPGMTYRYRLAVGVVNPLFQKGGLHPSQAQQANRLTRLSSWSEWSQPIQTDPETYFFVTSGSQPSQEATIETWRIYRGAWRSAEFKVRAGDPIGRTVTLAGSAIDIAIDAIVVDLNFEMPASRGIGSKTVGLYYLDLETGKLMVRTVEADSESDTRIRIRNESRLAEGVAELRPQ